MKYQSELKSHEELFRSPYRHRCVKERFIAMHSAHMEINGFKLRFREPGNLMNLERLVNVDNTSILVRSQSVIITQRNAKVVPRAHDQDLTQPHGTYTPKSKGH